VIPGTATAASNITYRDGYLKAELFNRQTALETQEFLVSLAAAAEQHKCTRALISVRESKALFKVEEYGISSYFKLMGANPSYRVALLSDSEEGRVQQEYIVLLARQYGAQVRNFRGEADAVAWLVSD